MEKTEIGNILFRDYMAVYLFLVIWSMYSSDRMITLAGMFKNYDKNIVFKDCQMHFLNIYLRRKEMPLIFFRNFVKLPAKINHYWTLFETLAEIERFQRTTTLHGRLAMDMFLSSSLMSTISPQGMLLWINKCLAHL